MKDCIYCGHEITADCNSLTYILKNQRLRLCRNLSGDENHPQDCYKLFREFNK